MQTNPECSPDPQLQQIGERMGKWKQNENKRGREKGGATGKGKMKGRGSMKGAFVSAN